jgi:hypothetical protein
LAKKEKLKLTGENFKGGYKFGVYLLSPIVASDRGRLALNSGFG